MDKYVFLGLGAVASVLVGLAFDYASGETVRVDGTVRATSFQPSSTGVSTGPTVGGNGQVGQTTMVTTTSEKRTVVVDTVGGFVEAEADKDVFWSLEQGHRVTITGRVGGVTGWSYGWKVPNGGGA